MTFEVSNTAPLLPRTHLHFPLETHSKLGIRSFFSLSNLGFQIYTAVGNGSASIINQNVIDKVDQVVLPYLQTKDYNRALVEMITAYSAVLRGEYYPAVHGGKPWYSPLPLWAVYAIGGAIIAIILIIIIVIILVVLHRRKTQGYSVGHVASRNADNTRM